MAFKIHHFYHQKILPNFQDLNKFQVFLKYLHFYLIIIKYLLLLNVLLDHYYHIYVLNLNILDLKDQFYVINPMVHLEDLSFS